MKARRKRTQYLHTVHPPGRYIPRRFWEDKEEGEPPPDRSGANAHSRRWFAAQINSTWQKAVETIIATGRMLLQAKTELNHGEFGEMIEKDLAFGPRVAQMLMQIAKHPVLTKAKFISLLPASYGTLYDLATLPEPVLQEALAQELISPRLMRREIPDIAKKILERTGDGLVVQLLDRLNTLIIYTKKWPDATEVAERLWGMREAAEKYAKDCAPHPDAASDWEEPLFYRAEDAHRRLIGLTNWLTKFGEVYKSKMERLEEEH